ncbi:MAG: RES domain-containing protein [Gammaproteobacteria bacterium]|nr:MAG: RES domain-containing protein [Gammaproteobacteria bacterium]
MNPQDHKIFFLLDEINPHAIKTWIKRHQKIVDYTAQHHAFFASRRSQVMEKLRRVLRDEQKEYVLDNPWSRIVSQQYSNTPLSTTGSVLSMPGGRFNIGKIDTERFPQFPALYLAEDMQTAYLESVGLTQNESINGLTTNELAVAGNFSHFQITGQVAQILDLTKEETLVNFYELIKDIELPIYFRREAKNLGINPPLPVNSLKQLYDTIFAEDWRFAPMQLDIPANSQILGQIARSAGLEGILYRSVRCRHLSLCLFPDNFKNSESCIEIVGEAADTVIDRRLDKNTYEKFLPTKWD